MNKHLRKIIDDYIEYKQPFIDDLIESIHSVKENCDDWFYYENYIILRDNEEDY